MCQIIFLPNKEFMRQMYTFRNIKHMKGNKDKEIPPIDLNSRLVQLNPSKMVHVKKMQPSSQRSSCRGLTPKILRRQNENEDYYQQEQLIDEKYHLVNDINNLKKEVEGYNQQIQKFIQENQTSRISSLSHASHASLNTLSTYISELQEEFTEVDQIRKISFKTFSTESKTKLEEEIYLQRCRIQSLQESINFTKQKVNEIYQQTATEEIRTNMEIGEQQRYIAEALMNKLDNLDHTEEILSEELNKLIDSSSVSVSYLATLERLTKKLSHLQYQRIYKQKEHALRKAHASVKNSYTIPVIPKLKSPEKETNEEKQVEEPQVTANNQTPTKIPEELKKSLHVKFNVPENLGIPRPVIRTERDYCFSYVRYLDELYGGLDDEYEYYYEEDDEDVFE